MATLYFNNAVDTALGTLGNWWQDDTYSVPAIALPSASDDLIIKDNSVITGNDNDGNPVFCRTITISQNVTFIGNYSLPTFSITASNGIVAEDSYIMGVTINANGTYTNCNLANVVDYGTALTSVGNVALYNCFCISTHDSDPPAIVLFTGNVDAYYPTTIATGAVTGTLTRHGYTLENTCAAHCNLNETSGTRSVLDLYEEEGITQVVLSGAGVVLVNGTYTRQGSYEDLANTNQEAIISYNGNEYQIDLGGGDYYYTTDFVDWFCTNSAYNPPPTTDSSITSAFAVGYGTGLIGNAAKFNENSLINNDSQLQVEFSVSLWVKKSIYAGIEQSIFGTGLSYGTGLTIYFDQITNPVFPFQPIGSKLKLYMDSAHGDTLSSDPIILNDWYHCVATITPNRTKFYVNGEYIGVINEQDAFNTGGIALSKFYGGNTLKNNTLVDELNIFNIELNQTQVNNLYNNGLGLGYPFTIAGAKKIDLYKLLGIPFPAKDYKYSRLTNLPFFVKI